MLSSSRSAGVGASAPGGVKSTISQAPARFQRGGERSAHRPRRREVVVDVAHEERVTRAVREVGAIGGARHDLDLRPVRRGHLGPERLDPVVAQLVGIDVALAADPRRGGDAQLAVAGAQLADRGAIAERQRVEDAGRRDRLVLLRMSAGRHQQRGDQRGDSGRRLGHDGAL